MKKATNEIQNDGFGSQYQYIICALVYCDIHQMEFIYTPTDFKTVYENEADNIENIMNIKNYRNI